jgi:hypothetical protein
MNNGSSGSSEERTFRSAPTRSELHTPTRPHKHKHTHTHTHKKSDTYKPNQRRREERAVRVEQDEEEEEAEKGGRRRREKRTTKPHIRSIVGSVLFQLGQEFVNKFRFVDGIMPDWSSNLQKRVQEKHRVKHTKQHGQNACNEPEESEVKDATRITLSHLPENALHMSDTDAEPALEQVWGSSSNHLCSALQVATN